MTQTKKAYLYQRFSSDRQKDNSSLYRQTEAQEAWLSRHPDVIVEERLIDEALSGFKGHHLEKGALGRLVEQIEKGNIEKGSLILVEHFSRLTRQNIDKAEELIRKIWDANITIVTVRCGSEYPPSSINDMATRIKLIVEIEAAYKDSKWRSDKAKASHAKKRVEASKGVTPRIRKHFWLDTEGKLNQFSVAVKDMFTLYLEGKGQTLILRTLQHKYPDFEPIQKMQATTVIRCIKSMSCIGLWRGNKVFERAVSDEIFYQAQKTNRERLFKNVQPDRHWPLSGLIECGHCGKGMSIQQSGKSLPLLRCSNKQRKGKDKSGCDAAATFPYSIADHYFSYYVYHQVLSELTIKNKDDEANNSLNKLEELLKQEKLKFSKARKQYDHYNKNGDELEVMLDLMQSSSRKIKEMEAEIRKIKAQVDTGFNMEISKEIFKLSNDPIKLNIALHKIGFKITLKNDELSYKGVRTLKYKGYSRKLCQYRYQINGCTQLLPTEGLTAEKLLVKSRTVDKRAEGFLEKLQDLYVDSIESIKKGGNVTVADTFKMLAQ
ncbi:recombinase family protein [Thalassotalea castellviae]|uniref:Recombinase family protein n=1 Tax=Thalassotalea castellviae TaxID=3075612 RepID=A0ABU2ZXK8_9GAMM|nr:recombinase family protein [Thalassotalea sp. W431]MDT0602666.1 recombinase family protein [Thalassotalea sp. W431]